MAFALPVDPTPASIEALAAKLPATARARLAWFPREFRESVIKPLRQAKPTKLDHAIDGASVAAFRIFVRLAGVTAVLMEDPDFAHIVVEHDLENEERLGLAITRRLGPLDPVAADEILEAMEWMKAILSGLIQQLRIEIVLATHAMAATPDLDDGEVRAELRGPSGTLLRGVLLTIAAIDVLQADDALPTTIAKWCDLALRELQAAANTFRAAGVVIPTSVAVSRAGRVRERPRQPHARFLPDLLPPGVEARIVEVFAPEEIWLFGSRARGAHAPASDWDLLLVVPDGVQLTQRMAETQRIMRRERIDLFLAPRAEFDEGKSVAGSLAYIATTEGLRIDGH